MVQKGRTTIYVDKEKAQRIREDLGIDLSTLTSQALDIADSDLFADVAVELRLKIIDELIKETNDNILEVQTKLVMLDTRLQEAVKKKESIRDEWEKNKQSIMYARYLYQLNQIVISSKYNEMIVREAGRESIQKILEISPMFNLGIHITELKKEMRA